MSDGSWNRDVLVHNRRAWNAAVDQGNPWTRPVTHEEITAAQRGDWGILLTETTTVPREWFPEIQGRQVLCLAAGGGQQGPILAAAGACVTVFDLSPRQLEQDRFVAEREGLSLRTVEGDMRDLSAFSDGTFDLVVHPVSNCFVPDVQPVWNEVFRVLHPGAVLLAGFVNPIEYIFDPVALEAGEFRVKYSLPYSDTEHMDDAEHAAMFGPDAPFEFSHSLEALLGGQLRAGLVITDIYEDYRQSVPTAKFYPSYLATRAVKPV